MPRMIELIRSSSVPSNLMQSAARGALSVPQDEMIEILVYLATETKIFSERARLTLAGWDENASQAAASNSKTPQAVLSYFSTLQNLRPTLLPALLENPAVSEDWLMELASSVSRHLAEAILNSERAGRSRTILTALISNANLNESQTRTAKEKLSALGPDEVEPAVSPEASPHAVEADSAVQVSDETVEAFLAEHAAEIAADGGKPFQAIGGVQEEITSEAVAVESTHSEPPIAVPVVSSPAGHAAAAAPALAKPGPKKKSFLGAGHEKGNALQKIAQLDVKGRIQLAMKGTKEERSLLIRDGTKVVAIAVLQSPKLTDAEVEKFATQKNVLEAVLRAVSMNRRFIKQYIILRNLVFNPRTPIDVSLGLIKNLLVQDLRNLSGNKEVSETVRKLALRMFRQKLEVKKD